MDEPQWDKPEAFFMAFRCMQRKYGHSFVEKGQIKFSTPNSWVEYAKQHGEGRGDLLEGTLATFDVHDIENAALLLNKYYSAYSDIEPLYKEGRCYLKKRSDMELPCFCMYYLMNKMFPCPGETGYHKLQGKIPASYFKDFADNLTPEAVEKLPPEERPCVVIIKDYPEFKRRLKNKLFSLGVSKEEIVDTSISYYDFEKYGKTGWLDFGQRPPMELAIKHIRFETQSEGRFIINTTNSKIKEILSEPIEIGSLADISQLCDQYFYDGIHIDMYTDICKITQS